jgi:hypothetical protein
MQTNFDLPDKHKSILLIGFGATHQYLQDIVKPDSYEEVLDIFGESDLTEAYHLLNIMGADQIYIMNLSKIYDLVSAGDIIAEQHFAYIVPLFYASEYFYDVLLKGKKTYYVQYLLRKLYKNPQNEAVILATDTKADLYEDLDAFLSDMDLKIRYIKENATSGEEYYNLFFVANMLNNIKYANVYLAGMIVNSNIDEYPYFNYRESPLLTVDLYSSDITPTFWIDKEDIPNELIYFKQHMDSTITVENLLNLYRDINNQNKSILKIFFILRILKYISKEMDFSELIGKVYREYYRNRAEEIAESFLYSIKGHYIIDYKMDKVYPKEDPAYPGTVNLYLKYSVLPINCSEWYTVDKKVI